MSTLTFVFAIGLSLLPGGGERIAYSRLTDGNWQIWTTAPDGTDARALTSDAADKRDPCWSPDGAFILCADHLGRLLRIPAAGGEPEALLAGQAPISEPYLSVDGGLAYLRVLQGPGYQVEVWATNLDGSDRRLLTPRGLRQLQPCWSPDGRRLAVAQFDPGAAVHALAVLSADGETSSLWVAGRNRVSDPSWSPDGRRIAFAMDSEGNNDIWIASEGSTDRTRLTFEPDLDASPSFSPDGTEIAFVSRRSGSLQLWVVPSRGGTPRRLTRDDVPCREPAWSPRRPSSSLTLGAVAVSNRVLDARTASVVDVCFELSEPAWVRAELEEVATGAVRERGSADRLEAGPNHLELVDQAEEPLPEGLHVVRLRAENEGGSAIWDPTAETGGTSVSVERLALEDADRRVSFQVPTPSWVRVRAGLDAGPLLATPLDWTPMAPGHVAVPYSGELPRGWAGFWDQPDRYVWVAAYSLPDNVLLVQGPGGAGRASPADRSLFHGTGRDLFPHARHRPSTCQDPRIVATVEGLAGSDPGELPLVTDEASLRIDTVDPADRALLETSRFEVVIYVDGQFLMEDEDSALPFHYSLDTSSFPEGRHAFLVNVGGYQDHIGATFAPFEVRRQRQ